MSITDIGPRLLWSARVTVEALRIQLMGFRRTVRPLMNTLVGTTAPERDYAHDLLLTARLPWSTCLTRSSALTRYLRDRGVAAIVHIGVGLPDEGLAAHAWVEVDGESVSEPESAHDHLAVLDCQ